MEAIWYDLTLTLINHAMANMGSYLTFFAAINLGVEAAILLLYRRGDV